VRILVLTDYFPPRVPADASSKAPNALTALLARGHQISVLAGRTDAPASGPEPDPKIAVRRSLCLRGALTSRPYNYFATRRVLEVAQPDLTLVWDATRLTNCAAQAVSHGSLATIAWAITSEAQARTLPRGRFLKVEHAFALDAKVRDLAAAANPAFAQAPVFDLAASGAKLDDAVLAFHHYLVKLYTTNRFDRYKGLSAYKRNPRPFLQ